MPGKKSESDVETRDEEELNNKSSSTTTTTKTELYPC
jgi:hypothetical protein